MFFLHFCGIIDGMSTLISEANPFFQDPKRRDEMIMYSVITSCGVEGIKVNEADLLAVSGLIKRRRPRKIYQSNITK